QVSVRDCRESHCLRRCGRQAIHRGAFGNGQLVGIGCQWGLSRPRTDHQWRRRVDGLRAMKFRLITWWVVVPLLALLWILLDRPRQRPPHQAEWLDAGGVLVRTVRAGSGDTTLLLLHGYGESLTTWRATFDALASGHRVVAIDLPGFGGSAKPDVPY